MKRVRGVLKLVAGLAVLAAILAIVVLFFLGPVVKIAVNTLGPKLLGVPVEVTGAAIYPLKGQVQLTGVTIGNPKGYSSDALFALKEVRVGIDVSSLSGEGPIIITEFAVIEPHVSYEVAGGKSNIEVLTANLPKSAKSKKPKEKRNKPESRKVIIDLLEFRDGLVAFRAKMTLGQAISLPLPELRLTEVGRAQGGLTGAEAVAKVLGELLNLVGTVVAEAGTAVLEKRSVTVEAGSVSVEVNKDSVKAVGSAAKGLLDAVRGDKGK